MIVRKYIIPTFKKECEKTFSQLPKKLSLTLLAEDQSLKNKTQKMTNKLAVHSKIRSINTKAIPFGPGVCILGF